MSGCCTWSGQAVSESIVLGAPTMASASQACGASMSTSIPAAAEVGRYAGWLLHGNAGALRPVLMQAVGDHRGAAAPSTPPADAAAQASAVSSSAAVTPGAPAHQQALSPHAELVDMPAPSEPQAASPTCVSRTQDATSSTSRADSSAADGADAGAEEVECIVCWAAGAEVVFQPCGHLCTCSSCAEPFLGQRLACPMCRATVAGGISVGL